MADKSFENIMALYSNVDHIYNSQPIYSSPRYIPTEMNVYVR